MFVATVASTIYKNSKKTRALFLTINLHFLKISRKRESLINRYCVCVKNKKSFSKKKSVDFPKPTDFKTMFNENYFLS